MRKIRIFKHISLDVIEHDDGCAYGAWTTPYRTPAGLAMLLEAYGTGFDLLLGRHEIRRDPLAGQPRLGAGQGLGRGHHRGYSRGQNGGRARI